MEKEKEYSLCPLSYIKEGEDKEDAALKRPISGRSLPRPPRANTPPGGSPGRWGGTQNKMTSLS